MKHYIYKLFTIENNLILTSDSMNYIQEQIKDEESLTVLLEKLLENKENNKIEVNYLKEVFEKLKMTDQKYEKHFFSVEEIKFREKSFKEKYKFLKKRVNYLLTPIYSIKERVECYIFGIYYINKNNQEVLEDDENIINISTSQINNNAFMTNDIYICCKGSLINGVFEVLEIHLPEISTDNHKETTLRGTDTTICIFSNFAFSDKNFESVNYMLSNNSKEKINMIIFMGKYETKEILKYSESLSNFHKDVFFIFVPHKNEISKSFIPKKRLFESKLSNVTFTSNPCKIKLFDKTISIIRENIFKNIKNKGKFIGKDYNETLCRTVLSQYSFNPFSLTNLDIDKLPDLFIVGQDYHSFSADFNNVMFVSCNNFEKDQKSYIKYSTISNKVEILSLK